MVASIWPSATGVSACSVAMVRPSCTRIGRMDARRVQQQQTRDRAHTDSRGRCRQRRSPRRATPARCATCARPRLPPHRRHPACATTTLLQTRRRQTLQRPAAPSTVPFFSVPSGSFTLCASTQPCASASATGPNFTMPAPRRFLPQCLVICASTEMAISAGVRAPMDRPAGPWMRARSCLAHARFGQPLQTLAHACAWSPVRLHRTQAWAARPAAPDRRSSDRASATPPPCAHPAAAAANACCGHCIDQLSRREIAPAAGRRCADRRRSRHSPPRAPWRTAPR